MEAPAVLSLANKGIKTGELEVISMQADQQANPPPDWLLLSENVYVKIFDYLNPGSLLSIRRVHPRWKRLAEASAETRTELLLVQCGCNENRTCLCFMPLMLLNSSTFYIYEYFLKLDGSSFGDWENWPVFNHFKMNGLKCASFNAKNAQLVARLFPKIRHFTVSHTSISARYIDQILCLLTQWKDNLIAFKFNSDYTLENPDDRVTRSQAVATANPPTEVYLNSQLTCLFRRLNSLPELKHLTLNYRNGKINSTIGDFAFLSRLEELHLDRTSPEANLQSACQRYLAPPVPGAPLPVLRRFTHTLKQFDSTANEFIRFYYDSPEALPLAGATIWAPIYAPHLTLLPDLLLRFSSLDCLSIIELPIGTSLASLSRTLAHHTFTILSIGTEENVNGAGEEEGEANTELVPLPSVRGLTITLQSPDHGRIYPLLAQIHTVFPRLCSLILKDNRPLSLHSPVSFTATASDPPELTDFANTLLAAYPLATQPTEFNQATSFLTIVRQINTLFPNITRNFAFKDHSNKLILLPANVQ